MADPALIRQVTDAAAGIFTSPPRRAASDAYLRQRGIDARALNDDWVIGYAPPGWTRLVDTLAAAFPAESLIDAGVARLSSRDTLIDTFRERVIFGIRHTDGTPAGFIGRDLSGHPGAPKYLNTRQHPLFNKSALLYGLHEGGQQTERRQPVLVEGPLDVLAIAARRHPTDGTDLLPIAACGTALTDTHARLIADLCRRNGSPAVVAMDGDAAGRAAALKAGERLRHAGLEVRAAVLPNGVDPADYLARPDSTLDTFRADHGLPLINLQVETAIAKQGDRMQWIEGRLAALRSVADSLASYPADDVGHKIGWLATALHLETSTVTAELVDGYGRRQQAERRLLPTTSRIDMHSIAM